MAYQNVRIPRIYINVPEYLALSDGRIIDPIFRTLPVIPKITSSPLSIPTPDLSGSTEEHEGYNISFYNSSNTANGGSLSYIAILGHDSGSYDVENYVSDLVNGTQGNCSKGFSISYLHDPPSTLSFPGNKIGSVVTGFFYDFPHAPDLNLTLSYEYDGVREVTTKGGHTITNSLYSGPPAWGPLGAWEIGGNPAFAKSGRRIWSISFSYLTDSAIFPDSAGLTNLSEDNLSLLYDDTLQRCIHFTHGGQIPFIFQPDNTVTGTAVPEIDQFAIAKFDMKSFSFNQVASNVYNVKLKIKEIW